jgi:dienelactone hydrolase
MKTLTPISPVQRWLRTFQHRLTARDIYRTTLWMVVVTGFGPTAVESRSCLQRMIMTRTTATTFVEKTTRHGRRSCRIRPVWMSWWSSIQVVLRLPLFWIIAATAFATVVSSFQASSMMMIIRPQSGGGRMPCDRSSLLILDSVTRNKSAAAAAAGIERSIRYVENDDDDGDETLLPPPPMELPGQEVYFDADADSIIMEVLENLNVSQLKQQLRLRGIKVSGKKAELQQRLRNALLPNNNNDSNNDQQRFDATENDTPKTTTTTPVAGVVNNTTTRSFDDVSEYLDEQDRGKTIKTVNLFQDAELLDDDDDDTVARESSPSTEVWGTDARVMLSSETTDQQRIIVDALSKTTIEYRGSNHTYVSATIIASRDALKPFLRGGNHRQYSNNNNTVVVDIAQATAQRLREIQLQREAQWKRPKSEEDDYGLDVDDEDGIYANALHRDVSDWGMYTATGAQLSAQEVAGIVLLPDGYNDDRPFDASDDIIALAETIAFECQPVIVMVPDIFRRGDGGVGRGDHWDVDNELQDQSRDDEEGHRQAAALEKKAAARRKKEHLRLSVDIRAAAACLRETYCVSSVVLWGIGVGGGRVLEEAASSWYLSSIHDVDGFTVGPPRVNPAAVIVWYPTYYDAKVLFGSGRQSHSDTRKMALLGIFAGKDTLPGATNDDAATLKALLEEDETIVDHMIKVFPGQNHGFAHTGMGKKLYVSTDPMERFVEEEFGGAGRLSIADSESEVACLLSTAFMESYSRVFLPTVGAPIAKNDADAEWRKIEMKDLSESSKRDIRAEINDAMSKFVEVPIESGPLIDPFDPASEEELRKILRSMEDPDSPEDLKISDDDDLLTVYGKLINNDENFQIW